MGWEVSRLRGAPVIGGSRLGLGVSLGWSDSGGSPGLEGSCFGEFGIGGGSDLEVGVFWFGGVPSCGALTLGVSGGSGFGAWGLEGGLVAGSQG